jgi:hypothetical protein
MPKIIFTILNVSSALVCILLITVITVRAEVSWANSSHTQMWAEAAGGNFGSGE